MGLKFYEFYEFCEFGTVRENISTKILALNRLKILTPNHFKFELATHSQR